MLDLNRRFTYQDGKVFNRSGREMGCCGKNGYVQIGIDGKVYPIHRIIWEMHNGPIPKDMLIDHINCVRNDNRIENLRLATKSQNNSNQVRLNRGDLPKGVYKNGKGFRASISFGGKLFNSTTFSTIAEAEGAAVELRDRLHGEFSRHG